MSEQCGQIAFIKELIQDGVTEAPQLALIDSYICGYRCVFA